MRLKGILKSRVQRNNLFLENLSKKTAVPILCFYTSTCIHKYIQISIQCMGKLEKLCAVFFFKFLKIGKFFLRARETEKEREHLTKSIS